MQPRMTEYRHYCFWQIMFKNAVSCYFPFFITDNSQVYVCIHVCSLNTHTRVCLGGLLSRGIDEGWNSDFVHLSQIPNFSTFPG